MTDVDLMLRFLMQILVVLGICHVIGWFGKKFLGQTQVVMEMLAGVVLGPSVFGALYPESQKWLFPMEPVAKIGEVSVKHPSMYVLYVVAQIGLIFYMFLVGLEFNVTLVSKRVKPALAVSAAGIIAPFALGATLALALSSAGNTSLFSPTVSTWEAALFLGAAMCITAFPMLARIVYENGIAGTSMGTLALGAGATDDATAWALLAFVLASFKHDMKYVLYAIGGGIAYGILCFTVVRRLILRIGLLDAEGKLNQNGFVIVMLFLFTGAVITDAIGLYAVFGAFIMGGAMPRGEFVETIRTRLESVTVGVLLPFFFVYSGLNTKIGLLNTPAMWGICGLMCAAAIIGKFGGCALAARWCGESWRESAALGVLMNSRGLMELIIINIGLQQKLITPTLFTMLVIMAILTTLMASPIFRALYNRKALDQLVARDAALLVDG